MDTDSISQIFFVEADEILINMEEVLLRMDDGDINSDSIDEIFRAAHTIKGSAGMFGLTEIVDFTHTVENALDFARKGKITIDDELLSILLSCRDHICLLIEKAKNNEFNNSTCTSKGEQILKSLRTWLSTKLDDYTEPTSSHQLKEPTVNNQKAFNHKSDIKQNLWFISAKFGEYLLQNGMDPLAIFRFLATVGDIIHITTITNKLPLDGTFDAEKLYLEFEILLRSDAALSDIENAFTFVREESNITIIPPRSNIEAYIDLIKAQPNNSQKIGEILVAANVISTEELELALDAQKQQAKENKPVELIGNILVDLQAVEPTLIDAALHKQKTNQDVKTNSTEARFIRVEAERLDKLINLIGELVVNRQRIDLLSSRLGNSPLNEAVASMGSFTEQIRDAALTLRMVAIGDTFIRFKRVVRDTAKELGKEIELEIEGADTELDRSMVEKLNDPLMHIVRNAMDHGIESIDIRKARNKPNSGTITLKASHESGNILIEITDDGGGLDTERIRKKAIANGVIEETSQLSHQELCMLIFHAGLSTAETVTNLSGRGVGMDVVKRNIESLHGSIEIETELGVGTCISIRLPLTLAIIDGFHVAAGNIDFIVPQNTILECVDLATLSYNKEQHCVNLRGEQVPYIRLQELFNLEPKHETREKLVVVQFGEKSAGIVVDNLFGEVQTVVKPMGPIFHALKGIGGSSLLGTGAVALILDVQQLINFAMEKELTGQQYLLAGTQE